MNRSVTPSAAPGRAPSGGATWGTVSALVLRELYRLRRERSRWTGLVLQPLLLWAILGAGLRDRFVVPGASGLDYSTFFFPGVVVMTLLFTAIFGTMSVIEDRQQGFLQGVIVAPAPRFALVLGKVLGVTCIALVQMVLLVAVAPLAGFSLAGVQLPMLVAALLLTAIGLVAVGFAMAWRLPSTQAYHAVMSVVLIPLWVLSGAMFPVTGGVLGAIMAANPMTYAVAAVRHAFAGGLASTGPSPLVSFSALLAFAVLALLVATRTALRPSRRIA